MNYFEARRAERLFLEFRALVQRYWQNRPVDRRDGFAKARGEAQPERPESREFRVQIAARIPEIKLLANELGTHLIYQSYPAPMMGGGPVIPISIFDAIVNRDLGHKPLSEDVILDGINQCIGAAAAERRRAGWRLANPFNWFVSGAAYLLRIPFIVMREAGVPPKVEETIAAHAFKVLLAAVFGLGILGAAGEALKRLFGLLGGLTR